MKNLIYICLITIIGISIGSCEKDLLVTVPNDRISSQVFWQTDNDAVLAANAIYPFLEGTEMAYWDAMSDIGHFNLQYEDASIIGRGVYDKQTSRILNEWKSAYSGIQSANIFMDNVDRIQTINQSLVNRLKGEVRVLRAYCYIKLASLFGDVPLVATETTLEESRQLTRTPVAQVWDFISQELTDAAALLPLSYPKADLGRITKGAALALKARAMLYAGRYTEAAAAAKEVMDLTVYSLYPSYKNLFSYAAENNPEVILDRQYIAGTLPNNIFAISTANSQYPNTSYLFPTKQAVDAYKMNDGKDITDPTSDFDPYDPYTNRDPRLKYSIVVMGDVLLNGKIYDSRPGSGTTDAIGYSQRATNTGFNLKKYVNIEDLANPNNCGINIILLRYAEVLLTYAEAKIEANQIDQSVLDAINLVRQRPDVNMPAVTIIGSQSELRKIVRDERLAELAFEGLRFIDIRRWRIAEDAIPGTIYGMTYTDGNGDLVTTISIPLTERIFDKNRDYLWPIPQKEIELNPLLTQNPNW